MRPRSHHSCRGLVREPPVSRRPGGTPLPHLSCRALLFCTPCSILKGHDHVPPPFMHVAGESLCSGGSRQGLRKDVSRVSRVTASRGLAPPALLTSEAQLTVANPTVLCRALLLLLAACAAPLDALIELAPAMPPRVLLQAFLLGPSVLKPNLPHKHKGHTRGVPTTNPQPPGSPRQGICNFAEAAVVLWPGV